MGVSEELMFCNGRQRSCRWNVVEMMAGADEMVMLE